MPYFRSLALFGMTLTEYGTHYKAIGRLDESERAFSRALAIAKQVLGPSHEQVFLIFLVRFLQESSCYYSKQNGDYF